MAKHDDGGPVYPHDADWVRDDKGGYVFTVDFHPGMSLWAYYAGQALAGETANPAINMDIAHMVEGAAMIADAMIAELRRREKD